MDRKKLTQFIQESNGQLFESVQLCQARMAEISRYVVDSAKQEVANKEIPRQLREDMLKMLDIWTPLIEWTVEVSKERKECVRLENGWVVPDAEAQFMLRITTSAEKILAQTHQVIERIKDAVSTPLLKEGRTLSFLLRDLHTRLYMDLPGEDEAEVLQEKLRKLILRNFDVRIINAEDNLDYANPDYFDCSTSVSVDSLTTTIPAIIAADDTCICKGFFVLPMKK